MPNFKIHLRITTQGHVTEKVLTLSQVSSSAARSHSRAFQFMSSGNAIAKSRLLTDIKATFNYNWLRT